MARPTIYNDEMLAKAQYYVDNYKELGDVVPMVCGLAVYLGISRETCYAWAKEEDKEAFSDIVCELMSKAERGLMNGALTGDLNAPTAKLALTKHGYTDKQTTELTGANGGAVEVIYSGVSNGKRTTD